MKGTVEGQSREAGVALISALVVILSTAVLAMSFLSVSTDDSRQLNQRSDLNRLDRAAESVVALAADRLWGGFLATQGGQDSSLPAFQQYLSQLGIEPVPPGEDPAAAAGTEISGLMHFGRNGQGTPSIDGAEIDAVSVVRHDQSTLTELFITGSVMGRSGKTQGQSTPPRSVQQVFVTEDGDWEGTDYALLANNVNCIMCHAQIDSAQRFHNSDPSLSGSFGRVKVGSLENLTLRSNNGSVVAGSLHVRGNATLKDGAPITNWSKIDFSSVEYDSLGQLAENAWAELDPVRFSPAAESDPAALENLYLNYSSDSSAMVDGYLPETFPAPFPDDGGLEPVDGAAGNRIVDDSEFDAIAQAVNGSISGGTVHVSEHGERFSEEASIRNAMTAGNASSLSFSTDGNVILTGTIEDPILLNGDVAIRGDVIIQGYVQGEGTINASGNVYVPSNLQYLDAGMHPDSDDARAFGVGEDGSPNQLSIMAGGSIVLGDLFHSKKGAPTGYEGGPGSFVISELALFNRTEWAKAQPVLPGRSDRVDSPSTWSVPNEAYEGADYVPRYYSFTEGGDVPIFVVQGKTYFDEETGTWRGKEHGKGWDGIVAHQDGADSVLYDAAGKSTAAVHGLTATNGWVSVNALSEMMDSAMAAMPAGSPLKIDATLYSNNSIFGIAGKKSPVQGQVIINGALLAPDIGLLIPGNGDVGLHLNFDARQSQLRLEGGGALAFRRKLSFDLNAANRASTNEATAGESAGPRPPVSSRPGGKPPTSNPPPVGKPGSKKPKKPKKQKKPKKPKKKK